MVLGVLVGVLTPDVALFLQPIGTAFIRLLRMIIVPLIFSSLITGVVSLGSVKHLGRLGSQTFLYYLFSTLMAVVIGLIMVNLIQPGVGTSIDLSLFKSIESSFVSRADQVTVTGILQGIIPTNLVDAVLNENMLGIIFFSVLLGVSLLYLGPNVNRLKRVIEEANTIFLKITEWIMRLSPYGVFSLIAALVAQTGFMVFKPLFFYVATVLLAIFIHSFLTLSGMLLIVARYSPAIFFKKMFPALATAFSTDSSLATLPVTMDCLESRVGVSKKVTGFVAPLGATINMDGTALYEAVAAVFIAQVFGVDLSLSSQILIMVTAILASVGAAGIPSAGLVTMVIVLKAVHLPLEGLGILLAVDRILDMFRTTVNVSSDACGAIIVARFGGECFLDTEHQR